MYTWEIYPDRDKQFRVNVLAQNGQIVASFGEGYVKKAHAVMMAQKLSKASGIELVVNDLAMALDSANAAERKRLIGSAISALSNLQDKVVAENF